jgi:hypothetical protein
VIYVGDNGDVSDFHRGVGKVRSVGMVGSVGLGCGTNSKTLHYRL